jgi:hypothetical protein
MKETTKTFIDGLCVGSTLMYLAIGVANLYGWLTVFTGIAVIAFSYATLIIALAADEERKWRRKHHDAGTHDYYGNKIEKDDDR